jgi:predicted TIM-barrel fold metal-dependent hydrolase
MAGYRPTQIRKPSDETEFERNCGAKLTNAVIDLIGDHVLMYASDYPHGESHFPESVSIVLDWEMDAKRKRKLLWDNATRFYARAPVG